MDKEFEKTFHELREELVKRNWFTELEVLNKYYRILQEFDELSKYHEMLPRVDDEENLNDDEINKIISLRPKTPNIKEYSKSIRGDSIIIPSGTFLYRLAKMSYEDTVKSIKERLDVE